MIMQPDEGRPQMIRGSSFAAQTAEALLSRFGNGATPAGTRLPPERQLAAELGVGRSAVREGLAALELLGVVEIRPGSGTYLRGSSAELLPRTLQWGLLLNEHRTEDLLQIRHVLERECARLAAQRLEPSTADELSLCVDQQRAGLNGDIGSFIAGDARFHHVLAVESGNQTMVELLTVVRALLRVWLERQVQTIEDMSEAVSEHNAILQALRSGDGDLAAAAMERHMLTAASRIRRAPEVG